MWKNLEIKGSNYIFKMKSDENHLKLTISDFKSVWKEKITSSDILSRFEQMNPSFESNENIKDSVVSIMNSIDKAAEVDVESKDDKLIIRIKSDIEKKYIIWFKFILTKLPGEDFFSEITSPMIQTILHLEESHCEHINLLKKKDRELQEYKLEKGEISREDLKTEPYNCNLENDTRDDLMLNLFKKIIPRMSRQNCPSEDEFNTFVKDKLKQMRPPKRLVYSSKNSNKKPLL